MIRDAVILFSNACRGLSPAAGYLRLEPQET